MGIRMGSAQFMYNYQHALNNAYQNQAKLYEQADGSSIHRPSDNPMNYTKLLRSKVTENENEQYRANVKSAASWMNNSDAVMIHMTDIMKTIEERSVSAADEHNSQTDCEAIYKEMFANMQELIASANTQIGDRYLFAGQKDLTQPFSLSVDERDRGLPKTLDNAQSNFFRPDSAGTSEKLVQFLSIENEDGETFYLDTKEGTIYTKEFVDTKYRDLMTQGYKTLKEAKDAGAQLYIEGTSAGSVSDTPFDVSKYFDNQGCLRDSNNNTITGNGGTKYTFTTISQRIVTYNGDENLISMVKLNGATDPASDTVNSTGKRMFGTDIFDDEDSGNDASGSAMLNELLCVCSQTQAGNLKWMSSDGITIADVSHSKLLVEETRIGARRQLYESVETMLEAHADNITEDINNVSGTDISRLATRLMELTTLYNMSLSMGGRILPQSLADYL